MIAPDTFYQLNDPECLLTVFDLRESGAAEALHRQRARWERFSDLEPLDEDHFVLIVRPGWLLGSAA